MRYLLFIFFVWIGFSVTAQDSKVRLAYQYYQSKEFEKAAVLFEELYKQNNAQVYFSYTVNSLIEIKEFEKAEKIIKKQIRKDKRNLQNYIELGYLLKVKEDIAGAEKQYDYVLRNLPSNKNEISRIANYFLSKREFELANQTYLKGRKMLPYQFHLEMANAYAYQRKSQEMVDEYLDLLQEDPSQRTMVENSLQSKMVSTFDENLKDILKKTLIKRIQKESNAYIYSELLIWLYIQEENFGSAIIQAKALDKRRKEGGMRLLDLGEMALVNNQFVNAAEAFEYVLKKGQNSPFYINAKLGYLDVLYQQVVLGQIKGTEEIKNIENQYLEAINEFGNQAETIRLVKDLAHLQAFYLGKSSEAIKLLSNALEKNKLEPAFTGVCKIELGDILLLQNSISQAILEYAQAAKMNDANEIGDKAKYKRAMLAFYTGNFVWAQAQLEVLKGGTSKLIANDAFQLSMLIKDNTGMDSAETALKYYARSEMFLEQSKENEALATLDTLEVLFKTHSLIDDVLYLKARIYEKQGNLENTISYLERIVKDYSIGLLGDDATYKLAQIYDYQLNNNELAQKYYKKIIFDYPGSIYVVDARKRFRYLRGDKDDKPG
ncbi:MAG: tetratricopeptide repeat protein [Bacteroidales bacterium]|nr:tetratricopeptide repeat protein [Bacteroidales bacterium]